MSCKLKLKSHRRLGSINRCSSHFMLVKGSGWLTRVSERRMSVSDADELCPCDPFQRPTEQAAPFQGERLQPLTPIVSLIGSRIT